ncbi:uncharacterized protein [Pempheris klunzingeri]|uniref:uncharacterized protein n=1 Tax=Pempheris klunzingeri TaxID=3127111 RepID=UPI00397EBE2F
MPSTEMFWEGMGFQWSSLFSSIMLVRALLQTSLVLWLAQQTLQGGVGIGVKPGGALGALGSRYGSKAMKTGMGRYPGAQLGVGGYRALGLGGRAGLKQGGYGNQGAYGASLGTGMGLGAGLPNGLGLSLGHGGKRVYGAGLGTLPGYGALAGIGYPGARPGVSTADLGGPEMASQGQAVQDLKREKSRALGPSYGEADRTVGPEMLDMRRSNIFGNTNTPAIPPPGAQGGESYEPMWHRRGTASHGATLASRQQLPLDIIRSLGSASSRATTNYASAAADQQAVKDLELVAKDINGPRIRGTVAVETRSRGSLNLQVQGGGSYEQVIPAVSGTQSLGIASVEGQEGYIGGAGNYLAANLGAGGYGAGLGQGAYLGGAAGKLGGYGEGATGYLGAMAGNGFGGDAGAKALSTGYGNGYSDGYGAGLGYPAELADGAENKAGKSEGNSF